MSAANKNKNNNCNSGKSLSWWEKAKVESSSLPRSTLAMSKMKLLDVNYSGNNDDSDSSSSSDIDYDSYFTEWNYNRSIKGIIVDFNNNPDIIWFAFDRFPLWANYILADTCSELLDNQSYMIELSKLLDFSSMKHHTIFPPFMYASSRLKNNREFVIEVLKPVFQQLRDHGHKDRHLQYIVSSSSELFHDEKFAEKAVVMLSHRALRYTADKVLNKIDFWKQMFQNHHDNERMYQHVPGSVWHELGIGNLNNNAEFWKQLIVENGFHTIRQHAPARVWDAMLDNPKIILSVLDDDYKADVYMFDRQSFARCLNDKEFVCQLVQLDNQNVVEHYFDNFYPDSAFLDDEDVMFAAVSKYAWTLSYGNSRMKNVRKIVSKAVQESPSMIRYASPNLRYDKFIALKAVQRDGLAIRYFTDGDESPLSNDIDVALAAVENNGDALQYVCVDLQNNQMVVLVAVRQKGEAIRFASASLQNDMKVAMEAVQQNVMALEYVSQDLQKNKMLVLTAVQKRGWAIKYACPSIRNDIEVATSAVQQGGRALNFLPPDLQNNKALVLDAVKQDGRAVEYSSPSLRNDKEVAMEAVLEAGVFALTLVSEELQNDTELKLVAEATSEMNRISSPKLEALSNYCQLPFFLEKATNHPLVVYYILLKRNNLLSAPASVLVNETSPQDNKKCKRKREDD